MQQNGQLLKIFNAVMANQIKRFNGTGNTVFFVSNQRKLSLQAKISKLTKSLNIYVKAANYNSGNRYAYYCTYENKIVIYSNWVFIGYFLGDILYIRQALSKEFD